MSKLILTQYTDPMCSWCYGTEPALKKLSFLMGDEIEIRYVLGLMLPDPAQVLGTGESCLLYTSDAADDMQCVDLGGRRIIKKKFFQAEDGIRDFCLSRGLGDVYKRQALQ